MSMLNDHSYFMDNIEPESDIANLVHSKTNLPDERELPKVSLVKKSDNDVTYLLSKLSDEELIKLLNAQPMKNEYDLNDIVKIAFDSKSIHDNNYNKNDGDQIQQHRTNDDIKINNNNIKSKVEKDNGPMAFFKLDNEKVLVQNDDSNYIAVQKLNNLLDNYQTDTDTDNNSMDNDKKELLFDVLVSQLKALCCKKRKATNRNHMYKYIPKQPQKMPSEYMFLIVNDELINNGSDELISVDPDSLQRNSSVLLLGPITTQLTDPQLKTVIDRISKELSKPEYLPLLQQLSDGKLSDKNIKLSKSLVNGPDTRRYIKPHRCNHQSKLAKVYGGPKWLICTGYLNLNTPSLYD
ncbi:uncharacterized protein ACR2FA_012409 [Aphomia sociella]